MAIAMTLSASWAVVSAQAANGGHFVKYKNIRSRGRIHAASEPEPASRHRVSLR